MQGNRQQNFRTAEDLLDMPAGAGDFSSAGVAEGMGMTVMPAQAAPFQPMMPRKERNLSKVKQMVEAMANEFGQTPGYRWIYSWTTKNKDGTKSLIEGGTIKMANAIAACYGNCDIDVRVVDQGAKWIFYARFVDMETGFSTVRSYQQRKEQGIGMKDQQRAMDIVFQIGQSKAIRNVILNALPHIAAFAMQAARESHYGTVQKDPEKVRLRIVTKLTEWGPDVLKRVEKTYSRTSANWTVPDMARLVNEIETIMEGMANVDEVWPLETDAPADAEPTGGATTAGKDQQQTGKPQQQGAGEQAPKKRTSAKKVEPADDTKAATATSDDQGPAFKIIDQDGEVVGATHKRDYKTGDPIELGGNLYNVDKFIVDEETSLVNIHVRAIKAVPIPTHAPATQDQQQQQEPAKSSARRPTFGD